MTAPAETMSISELHRRIDDLRALEREWPDCGWKPEGAAT